MTVRRMTKFKVDKYGSREISCAKAGLFFVGLLACLLFVCLIEMHMYILCEAVVVVVHQLLFYGSGSCSTLGWSRQASSCCCCCCFMGVVVVAL